MFIIFISLSLPEHPESESRFTVKRPAEKSKQQGKKASVDMAGKWNKLYIISGLASYTSREGLCSVASRETQSGGNTPRPLLQTEWE